MSEPAVVWDDDVTEEQAEKIEHADADGGDTR